MRHFRDLLNVWINVNDIPPSAINSLLLLSFSIRSSLLFVFLVVNALWTKKEWPSRHHHSHSVTLCWFLPFHYFTWFIRNFSVLISVYIVAARTDSWAFFPFFLLSFRWFFFWLRKYRWGSNIEKCLISFYSFLCCFVCVDEQWWWHQREIEESIDALPYWLNNWGSIFIFFYWNLHWMEIHLRRSSFR